MANYPRIMDLPSELFELIADFLPAGDLNSLAVVCKSAKLAFEESDMNFPPFAVPVEADQVFQNEVDYEEKLWFPNLNGDMEEDDEEAESGED